MKKPSAIVFGLLLGWMQAVGVAPTPIGDVVPTVCACCDCGRTDCCVTSSTPDTAPAPAVPLRAGIQNELSFPALSAVAWRLPAAESPVLLPSFSPMRFAPGVPLFTRHCALLI